jgi:exo-beta-1,3-glucanase (GH17 family)
LTRIFPTAEQIDQDLKRLQGKVRAVRTYSAGENLEAVPQRAGKYGLKVWHGAWLNDNDKENLEQINLLIDHANKYKDTVERVIVGNEVLLRKELTANQLRRYIRQVKQRVSQPVTYADVWEFWLRYAELASAVDFVTIHILPYWEDVPVPARQAARHVDAIRRQVAAFFPGKEIFIGEFGWPSAGRMREGALPSPANQARSMHEVLALAKQENYRINLIEAYDQWWKRELEGTVGGHWGLYDAVRRLPKFIWGGAVSDHPHWHWQAFAGVAMAALTFAAAIRRPMGKPVLRGLWFRVSVIALISAGLIGWTAENAALETFTFFDALRSSVWTAVALLLPLLGARALASGQSVPVFAQILRPASKNVGVLQRAIGVLLVALAVISMQAAVALVFDGRYRDFPYAPLTGAVIPLLLLARWKVPVRPPPAELAFAATLMFSAVFIAINEGLANWQACWFAIALIAFASTLFQARAVPD